MRSSSSQSSVDGLSRPAGFLFLALIPLVTLIPYDPVAVWLTQDLILRWASAIVFILLVLGFLLRGKGTNSFQLDFPSVVLLMLAGWVLLSTWNSRQSFDSFYAFKSFVALLLWWFSLGMMWDRRPEVYPLFEKVFFWTACLAAFCLILTTLGHGLGMRIILENGVIPRQGLFTNPNIAAGFLGMAFLLGCLKALHREPVPLVGLGLIFLAWGLTQSRGSFLSMTIVVALYLVLNMKEMEERLRRWGSREWMIFGAMLLLALVPLAFMVNRFLFALDMDPRSDSRVEVWVSGFKMAMAQPLLGFGPGTFEDVYPAFRSGSLWNTTTAFAHNEYLQVAAECGWPALGLTLLFLGALLASFAPDALKSRAFRSVAALDRVREAAFYLILFEATHNFLDFTFHEWSHRLPLLAVILFGLRGRNSGKPLTLSVSFSRPAFLGGAGLLAFLVLWILGFGSARDYLARIGDLRASALFSRGDMDGAQAAARKSLGLRENNVLPWNVLGALEDFKAKGSADRTEKEKHFLAAREDFKKAIELSPYSLTPRENEIQSLINCGKLGEALELQKDLVDRAPELPTGYIRLGWIFFNMGRPKEAIKPAQRAMDLDSYFLPGYILKAQSLEAMGKNEEALKTYLSAQEMLQSVNLADPSGLVEAGILRLKVKP